MRWRDLDDRRVLVWGLGREGQAALRELHSSRRCRPRSVATFDDGPREVAAGQRPGVDLDGIDVVVKSPGVSRYRPEIVEFVARGGVVTSLTDLVLAERSGQRVIGVTGTKGKSTTAALVAHLLAAGGADVQLAGNIGRPAAEVLDVDPDVWLVLECSSYQCADVTVSPEIGVFTSIYEEHLDWHGSFAHYVADKLNLFRTCELVFVNGEQPAAVAATATLPGRRLVTDGDPAVRLERLTLAGVHNLRNANLAAHAALRALVPDGRVAAHASLVERLAVAFGTFAPLPHRMQTVGRFGNLTVVDDGLATAPEATLGALDVYAGQHVVLLVGGYDRGVDFSAFGRELATRTDVEVLAMGPAGERIADAVAAAGAVRPPVVGTLDAALSLVDPTTEGVLLLSPAATSYGEFDDYRARGAALRRLLAARGMIPVGG